MVFGEVFLADLGETCALGGTLRDCLATLGLVVDICLAGLRDCLGAFCDSLGLLTTLFMALFREGLGVALKGLVRVGAAGRVSGCVVVPSVLLLSLDEPSEMRKHQS